MPKFLIDYTVNVMCQQTIYADCEKDAIHKIESTVDGGIFMKHAHQCVLDSEPEASETSVHDDSL